MDTVKANGGKESQMEECLLCQDRHLLSWFKGPKKTPIEYPSFVEVRIMVIGVFKKNKKAYCQSNASSVDLENAVS